MYGFKMPYSNSKILILFKTSHIVMTYILQIIFHIEDDVLITVEFTNNFCYYTSYQMVIHHRISIG